MALLLRLRYSSLVQSLFASRAWAIHGCFHLSELELELTQSHMAQKPVLRGEVGCACVAREVSAEKGGIGERYDQQRTTAWSWLALELRCGRRPRRLWYLY